mmetsp:Transcript_69318/g.122394  ORF Transcript_69318/g.122394 Transcript_69318/m.122394 type:complete len:224 (+) Transcript_69318:2970-3641(+)
MGHSTPWHGLKCPPLSQEVWGPNLRFLFVLRVSHGDTMGRVHPDRRVQNTGSEQGMSERQDRIRLQRRRTAPGPAAGALPCARNVKVWEYSHRRSPLVRLAERQPHPFGVVLRHDGVPLIKVPRQQLVGQGSLNVGLDGAAHGPGPERGVVPDAGQEVEGAVREDDLHLPTDQPLVEALELQLDDGTNLVLCQWLKDNELVQTVHKFRSKVASDSRHNPLLHH